MTSHLEDHVIPPSRQREKPRGNLKWIGQDMKRIEDPRLLTGKQLAPRYQQLKRAMPRRPRPASCSLEREEIRCA